MHAIRNMILAVTLALSLFGLASMTAHADSNLVTKQLEEAGAIFVPKSSLPMGSGNGSRLTGGNTTSNGQGVGCSGASSCLNLIQSRGGQCKAFRCNSDGGTPVCWCDL